MATSTPNSRPAEAPTFPTVSLLVARPRLAYLYTELLKADGWTSTRDLVERTEFSQSTVYKDMRTLRDTSLVSVRKVGRERQYRAEPFKIGVIEERLTAITPTVVAAIGRQAVDENVEQFVDGHGVEKLVEAVRYVKSYVNGDMTERIAARELGIPALVGMTILIALEDTVRDMEEADPHFSAVRDAAEEGGPNPPREIQFDDRIRVTFDSGARDVPDDDLNNLGESDMDELQEAKAR